MARARKDDEVGRAGVYTRVSTQEQASDDKVSLEQQRTRCEAYCLAQGWEVVDTYEDAGVSGAKTERPALTRLLQDAKDGKLNRVVFLKLDRLGRSARDLLNLSHELDAMDVGIASVTDNVDTSSSGGRLFFTILAAFAEFERNMIAERMSAGRAERVGKGRLYAAPTAPFGYERTADKLIRPNPETAPIVRQMFEMAAQGMGAKAIGLRLDSMGIEPPMANHSQRKGAYPAWNWSTIYKILTNRRYVGEGSYNGEVMACPPIIDPLTFDSVQAGMKNRKAKAKRGTKNEYLLQYMGVCGTCKGNLASQTNVNGFRSYYCYHRRVFGPKAGHVGVRWTWPADDVETKVVNHLKAMLADPESYSKFIRAEVDQYNAALDEKALQIREAERELAEVGEERERLLTLYQRGHIDDAKLEERLPDVEQRAKALEKARLELGGGYWPLDKLDELKDMTEGFVRWVNGLEMEDFDKATFETKRAMVQRLVDKVTVHPDGSLDVEAKRNVSVLMPMR